MPDECRPDRHDPAGREPLTPSALILAVNPNLDFAMQRMENDPDLSRSRQPSPVAGPSTGDVPSAVAVVDVTIERADSVTITFDDGLVCAFPVGELRAACPCASCRGLRERGEVLWPRAGQPADISIATAEFAGAWGLSISWSDGHDAGIYAWAPLRRWWKAGRREPLTAEAVSESDAQEP